MKLHYVTLVYICFFPVLSVSLSLSLTICVCVCLLSFSLYPLFSLLLFFCSLSFQVMLAKHFFSRVLCLIIWPVVIYMSIFAFHFLVLSNRCVCSRSRLIVYNVVTSCMVIKWHVNILPYPSSLTPTPNLPSHPPLTLSPSLPLSQVEMVMVSSVLSSSHPLLVTSSTTKKYRSVSHS